MRKLNADEIECRVAQVTQKGCSLLLYKTARVDRAILDEEFGQMNWQNDFKVIDGKMYGYISVYDKEKKEWITKSDCGTESNTEAEKGQASDCFKRAGFKWGIGVELYTAPFIFIQIETKKNDKGKYELVDKYIKFEIKEIGYSEKGEINKLIINDSNGNKVYELGKYVKPEPEKTKDKKPNADFVPDVIKEQKNKLTLEEAIATLKETTDPKAAFNYFQEAVKMVDEKAAFRAEYTKYYNSLKG